MLKAAIFLGIPGTLGGIGLLYNGQGAPTGPEPQLGAYVLEVGVAYPESAVREALPDGLEPAPSFSGGIAIYRSQENLAGSRASAGYIWIDAEAAGTPTRYVIIDFASEIYEDTSTIALTKASLWGHELGEDGILHILAWPDRASGLEILVKPAAEGCAGRLTVENMPPTLGPGGSLADLHMLAVDGWCEAEAEVGLVRVTAPLGHMLRPFTPQQILWADIATPSGELVLEPANE